MRICRGKGTARCKQKKWVIRKAPFVMQRVARKCSHTNILVCTYINNQDMPRQKWNVKAKTKTRNFHFTRKIRKHLATQVNQSVCPWNKGMHQQVVFVYFFSCLCYCCGCWNHFSAFIYITSLANGKWSTCPAAPTAHTCAHRHFCLSGIFPKAAAGAQRKRQCHGLK